MTDKARNQASLAPTWPANLPSWRPASVLIAALSMAGCMSFTPTYERPALAVPTALPVPANAPAPAKPVSELPWRTYFPDTRLQQLIATAIDGNRDLRVAALNIEQLRAAYQIQEADRYPTLNGVLNGARQPSIMPPFPQVNSVTAGLSVSAFELDLFGRVKALSEAAGAQVMATEAARKAAHISLVAGVANLYYALWADRWQLALAKQTFDTRQSSLKLLQLKFDNGVLNELDLSSGQSLVQAARITIAQAQRQWAQDLSALNLLLGQPATDAMLPPEVDAQALAPAKAAGNGAVAANPPPVVDNMWPALSELPVGLSSEVLLQRPDIVQAEQQLISSNANIGAARASRFPRISLTATAGVVSDSLSGLFNHGRTAWTLAPAAALPLFDAGRTQASIDSAMVKRNMAVAQYDKAVQTAFKEVADALVARSTYADQAQAQLEQAKAEAARMRLSTLRYDTGVASQLDLLDSQRSLFAAQQALILAQLARQQAHISVYKALGGGWLAS